MKNIEGSMLLLYANPLEIKYVDYNPGLCIGINAKWLNLKSTLFAIKHAKEIVLFGSCGLLKDYWGCFDDQGHDLKVRCNNFMIPKYWSDGVEEIEVRHQRAYGDGFTTDYTVHCPVRQEELAVKYDIVDMESFKVAKVCRKFNVPFISVRYIIDRCSKKCMPIGINYFWRKYQHRRMQLKFNNWLKNER